jgi:hypothetical protein
MTTRMMFIAGALLLAGVARASTASAVPAGEEKILETGPTSAQPYVDLGSCAANSKAITEAMLKVPDTERGKVEAASGCLVSDEQAFPAKVDERDRR